MNLQAEVTSVDIEHCSVLLELLSKHLLPTYDGDPEEFKAICNNLNPAWMKRDLMEMFTEEAFLNLFKTQFGRGVLVGAFAQRLFDTEQE